MASNCGVDVAAGRIWREPVLLARWHPALIWRDLDLGSYAELREPVVTMLRERHKQKPCKANTINASHRGGQVRSSAEVAVMVMERRDLATMLKFNGQLGKGGTI